MNIQINISPRILIGLLWGLETNLLSRQYSKTILFKKSIMKANSSSTLPRRWFKTHLYHNHHKMKSCIDPVVKSNSTLLLPAILTKKGIISGNYIIHPIFLVGVPTRPINSLYMRYILECVIWCTEGFESQYERLPSHLKHLLVRTARK